MLDLQKRRVWLGLLVGALILLSMTAEKFRELVGDEASSKSGKFTLMNCFDMGSGTLACAVKNVVKMYVYNIRSTHVERIRQRATEIAITEALKEGLDASAAARQAQKAGTKAAKLANRQAKRILGPIVSSGWDFFEAIYYEGTMTEGFLRGTGTLFGTYVGGFYGEQRLGKLGYLSGSHLGSWVGGRIGLMVYDVVNGLIFLMQFVEPEESKSTFTTDNEGSSIVDDTGYSRIPDETVESEESTGSFTADEDGETSKDADSSEIVNVSDDSSDGWGLF